MKIKVLFVAFFCFFVGIFSVNASSITYNLDIDKDLQFSENIIYKVKNSELDKSVNYDFLTSVVNDSIYFDNDKTVKYKKTKSYNNGMYTVNLRNKYSYVFLSNSRILKECFSTFDYDISSEDSISFKGNSTFYCTHRANDIVVNITTPLKVSNQNATRVDGNTYTWTGIDDDFELRFGINTENSESSESPMDDIDKVDNNQNENGNGSQNQNQNQNNNVTEKENGVSPMTILIVVVSILFIIAIIALFSIARSKRNNSL